MKTHEFDVLVIGGGATGAGCALDATTRGLSTALVGTGERCILMLTAEHTRLQARSDNYER